jgi:phage-related tail protein
MQATRPRQQPKRSQDEASVVFASADDPLLASKRHLDDTFLLDEPSIRGDFGSEPLAARCALLREGVHSREAASDELQAAHSARAAAEVQLAQAETQLAQAEAQLREEAEARCRESAERKALEARLREADAQLRSADEQSRQMEEELATVKEEGQNRDKYQANGPRPGA